jgi:hypothetical protein
VRKSFYGQNRIVRTGCQVAYTVTDGTIKTMTDKEKGKAGTRGKQRALSVFEKHTIHKKCRKPKHLKESLAVFGAHFPDEKGELVKLPQCLTSLKTLTSVW